LLRRCHRLDLRGGHKLKDVEILHTVCVKGPRVTLRPFRLADAETLHDLEQVNRLSFAKVMPPRGDEYFTERAASRRIERDQALWQADQAYAFAVVFEGQLVGRVALSNVVRGAWQNATLGYWIDGRFQSQGLATEGVSAAVLAAFLHMSLHRLQAAVMPRNLASIAVVRRCGFQMEGLAPKYLNINGTWEDHYIFSLTRENYNPPAAFVLEPSAS
jgi:ribosomal-protein-alanine N-acetyltransferase